MTTPLDLADDLEKTGLWMVQVAECLRAMVAKKSLPDPHMIVEVVLKHAPVIIDPPNIEAT